MNTNKEYDAIIAQAHPFKDIKDLYDLIINDDCEDTYVLVWPQGEEALNLIKPCYRLGMLMNIEHLHRIGIDPDEYYQENKYQFIKENEDKCPFGDATVYYCKDLDTPSHPIPRLLMISHNGWDERRRDDSLNTLYTAALNQLAKEENRALLQSLTPEIIEKHRKEGKPIVFHDVPWYYGEEPDTYYYLTYTHEVSIPENGSFESVIERIKNSLEDRI